MSLGKEAHLLHHEGLSAKVGGVNLSLICHAYLTNQFRIEGSSTLARDSGTKLNHATGGDIQIEVPRGA